MQMMEKKKMQLFSKRWTFLVGCLCLLMLAGCPKSDGNTKTGTDTNAVTAATPGFKLYRSGIPKYDSYFSRVYKLRHNLWKSDQKMAAIPGMLRSALELPADAKKVDMMGLLKQVGAKFGNKLLFKAGTGIRLKPGVSDPKAQKIAKTLNDIYTTTKGMPKNLGGAVEQSKKLVTEGQALSKSAKNDFKGMNALKLPTVSAKLAESTKELGKVPGQVDKLSKTSVDTAKQIPTVLTSK